MFVLAQLWYQDSERRQSSIWSRPGNTRFSWSSVWWREMAWKVGAVRMCVCVCD